MRVLIVSEGEHELGGALRALMRRVLGRDFDCDYLKVSDPILRSFHGKGPGHFKKAVRCLYYAQENGYDAVVFVIDQDDQLDRRHQIGQAQDYVQIGIPRAMGVAIRTFDAWMLADELALSNVLGITVSRQLNPEENPDPKASCGELLQMGGQRMSPSEFYAAVAEQVVISDLEKRCPRSFATLAGRLRRL